MVVPLAFMGMGAPEVLLIMLVALILFGAERLPGLARSLGRGIQEFKSAVAEAQREVRDATQDQDHED